MDRARDGRLFCDAAALRSRVRKRLAATLPDATTMSHDSMLGDVVHGAFVCMLVPVKSMQLRVVDLRSRADRLAETSAPRRRCERAAGFRTRRGF